MGFRGVPTLGPAERGVVVGTSRSSWHSPTTWDSSSRRRRIRGVLLEEEVEPAGPVWRALVSEIYRMSAIALYSSYQPPAPPIRAPPNE